MTHGQTESRTDDQGIFLHYAAELQKVTSHRVDKSH